MDTEITGTVHSITITPPSDNLPAVSIVTTLAVEVEDEQHCGRLFSKDLARCVYGRTSPGGDALAAVIKPAIKMAVHTAVIDGERIRCYPLYHQVKLKDEKVEVHLRLTYLQDEYAAVTTHLIDHYRQPIRIEMRPCQLELPGVEGSDRRLAEIGVE